MFVEMEGLSAPVYVIDPGFPRNTPANMTPRSIASRKFTIHEVSTTMDGLDD